MRWVRGVTPKHGIEATHRAVNDNRPFVHDENFPMTLVFNFSPHRYAEPWYLGECRGMACVPMFRAADEVRLTQSPSGGGNGNPAWDFQWFIGEPRVNQRYQLVMRLLYAPLPKASNPSQAREQLLERIRRVQPR
jgi:hypothetical protein